MIEATDIIYPFFKILLDSHGVLYQIVRSPILVFKICSTRGLLCCAIKFVICITKQQVDIIDDLFSQLHTTMTYYAYELEFYKDRVLN